MNPAVGARRALLVFLLAGAATGLARADPAKSDPVVDRLDYYFSHPNSPGAFRALSGQGVAPFEMEKTGVSAIYENWFTPRPLMDRLFPGLVPGQYFNLNNCRPDYALQTLRARIGQLGPNHPYVVQWVDAQQAVFAACLPNRGTPMRVRSDGLPPPLRIEDPALAKLQADDRAYQTASIAFYRGDRQPALAAFRQIAGSDSPHRPAAIFMTAAIRAGSVSSNQFASDAEPLVNEKESIAEVRAMLADPSLVSIYPMAQELLGWIGATHGDAATRTAQVRQTLAALEAPGERLAVNAGAQRQYGLARDDIDRLHMASENEDGDLAWWLHRGPAADYAASKAMMTRARTDPMAAWLLFPASYVQNRPWAPFARHGARGWSSLEAFAKTRARANGPAARAWRRAAASVTRHYDPTRWRQVEGEQTLATAGDDQAIAELSFDFYHQVRTALEASGDAREPKAFRVALGHMKAFPLKTSETYRAARHDGLQYLMTVGRIAEARRWRDELNMAAPGAPYWCCVDKDLLEILAEDPAHFAAASASYPREALPTQNNLSIAALRALAKRPDVPAVLRARFARIAWGRTYALGETIDPELDQLTRTLNPQMTKGWTHAAGKPVTPEDRQALLDVLRSPGVNILIVDEDRDHNAQGRWDDSPGMTGIDLYNHDDDNWWCRWDVDRNDRDLENQLNRAFYGRLDLKRVDHATATGLRAQLKPALAASYAFRNQSPSETKALSQVSCAPKLLTSRALDWVGQPTLAFWERDQQAEALALAVKTTRYGCYSDGPHGAYSRAAWTELHKRFPKTSWAIKTKYWFSCPMGNACAAKPEGAH